MISINDLLIIMVMFLGSCLVVAVGATLIAALVNFIKMTKKVSRLIDDNAAYVNKTIMQLPALVDSLDKAGTSVKANADRVGTSLGAIEGMFTGTAAADESNTLMTVVNIAESILKVIAGYFAKKESG